VGRFKRNYFREADVIVIVVVMDWEPSSALSARRVLDRFFLEGVPMEKVVYPVLTDVMRAGSARSATPVRNTVLEEDPLADLPD